MLRRIQLSKVFLVQLRVLSLGTLVNHTLLGIEWDGTYWNLSAVNLHKVIFWTISYIPRIAQFEFKLDFGVPSVRP